MSGPSWRRSWRWAMRLARTGATWRQLADGGLHLTMHVNSASEDGQRQALAIFRTVRFNYARLDPSP